MKLFIASSAEAEPVANALRAELVRRPLAPGAERRLGDVLEVQVWPELFGPGQNFLEQLLTASGEADFAVVIADSVGSGLVRGEPRGIPSANVLFEYGLFMGRLASHRCFLVAHQGQEVYLPTDLAGIQHLAYGLPVGVVTEQAMRPYLQQVAMAIAAVILELGPNPRKLIFTKLDVWERVIGHGIDDLFERRKDALVELREDIARARHSILISTRVYWSELIQDEEPLVRALLTALEAGAAAGLRDPLVVTFVATDPDDSPTVARLWEIEDPNPGGEPWGSVENYLARHLRGKVPGMYKQLVDALRLALSARARLRGRLGRQLILRQAYFRNYLTPYSVALIDNSLLYVGFYTFTRSKNWGTYSPTMRLVATDRPGSWHDLFLEEVERTRRAHVSDEEDWVVFEA